MPCFERNAFLIGKTIHRLTLLTTKSVVTNVRYIKHALCQEKRMFTSEEFKNVMHGCDCCFPPQKQGIS